MRSLPLAVCAALIGLAVSAVAQNLRPTDLDGMAATAPSKVEAYGADPLQYGELWLPAGSGPFPVAVIIHGGCWTRGSPRCATWRHWRARWPPKASPPGTSSTANSVTTGRMARHLPRLGGGDDHLRALAQKHPLDLSRVVAVGHSAGAQQRFGSPRAAACRDQCHTKRRSPQGRCRGAIDGPVDLKAFIALDKYVCGKPVVSHLLGGSPEEVPGRYRESNPIELLPSAFLLCWFLPLSCRW